MATTPEGKVKALISKWIKKHKIPAWSVIPNAMGNSRGMSDVVAILPKSGKWLCIEAKAAGKKKNVTAHQQNFIDTINACGGIAVVVDCQEDIDQLEQTLIANGLLI